MSTQRELLDVTRLTTNGAQITMSEPVRRKFDDAQPGDQFAWFVTERGEVVVEKIE